ncbi:hypothetical protein [Nitrososphaera sp.]|uniref:hypothetical protein n=1 Tax=Nitrososphaera sp. TaxID=1971748 RepID=UPI002ED9A1E6
MTETLIISGDGITAKIAIFQSNIRNSWCACVDSSIPAFSMSDAVKKGYADAKKRGVKIRHITEITTGNMRHCKELMQYAELRHLGGVRGSFAVSEGEFVAGIRGQGSLEKLVYSNVPEVVSHQQDIFETVWATAVPAEEKMKELA